VSRGQAEVRRLIRRQPSPNPVAPTSFHQKAGAYADVFGIGPGLMRNYLTSSSTADNYRVSRMSSMYTVPVPPATVVLPGVPKPIAMLVTLFRPVPWPANVDSGITHSVYVVN